MMMPGTQVFLITLAVLALNIWLMHRRRRDGGFVSVLSGMTAAVQLLLLWQTYPVARLDAELFYINAQAGCYPWSPAIVEYHDGMTICPGQGARMRIDLTPGIEGREL